MSNQDKTVKEDKATAQGRVPKLRFPEFRNVGEWEESQLGDRTNKVGSGITPKGGDKNYKNDGHPFVRSQNVGWGRLILENVAYIDDDTHSIFSATEIEEGDVLLNITGASIGRCTVADLRIKGGNVNQHVCIIRTKMKKLNAFFLNQFILSQRGQSQIDSFQAGGNRQGLNFGQIRSFSVPLPSKIEEQQKIADCLSSTDELITAQTQKLDTLNAHKKGLMQQLFPAQGETVPKLRFPKFRDAGEWDEKPLNKVCNINPPNNGLPEKFIYIDLESVVSGNLVLKKEICKDDAPSRAQRLLKNGDVIYQMVRPYQKNNYFCNFTDGNDYVASTGYAQLRPFYPSNFLSQIVHTGVFVGKVLSRCTGSNYPAIRATDLSNIKITIPKPDEQKKIADFLSSIDELITAQSQKLDTLNAHKKGLIQQLFPSTDEVNG